MNREELLALKAEVEKQEETLRFDSFDNKTAYELGKYMTDLVYEKGIDLAISIRKLNGSILYQHLTAGTNLLNENWMNRKFNSVSMNECSSYACWIKAELTGETIATHALDIKDYAFCGGGFPIRLKSGELLGVIIVSNLPHEQDHSFIIEALNGFLNK